MNKKISLGAAVTFMLVIAAITFCVTMMVSLNYFNDKVLNVKEREEMYKKLSDVDRSARQNYAGSIDEEVLSNSLSAGFIRGLGDKYSSYLTKNEYERRLLEDSGKLVQIGITIQKDATGYFRITKVIAESPAAQAGILAGDMLVSIDGTDLQNVSQANAELILKAENGTKLTVVFRRDGVDTTKELQRKDITVPYVELKMLDKIAYVKIDSFTQKAVEQFTSLVNSAIKQGAAALVLDVRGNNTDSMDAAVSMLNILLPAGSLGNKVFSNGKTSVIGNSDQYSISIPMSVIINGKTGNAAEYFAATLRDFGVANLVGTISFGKCVIQELIPMTDGSAINITTAYVVPPSGVAINDVGLKPEYEVKLTAEQEQTFDQLTPETDPQIQKAVEVVNSKIAV